MAEAYKRKVSVELPPWVQAMLILADLGIPLAAGGRAAHAGATRLPSLLGKYPHTTADALLQQLHDLGGFSVQLGSGQPPPTGHMMGVLPSGDPRILERPLSGVTAADIDAIVQANRARLSQDTKYLGGWVNREMSPPKAYVEPAEWFPPEKIRQAVKTGEHTRQLKGWTVDPPSPTGEGQGHEFPVGNWLDFINSPEFQARLAAMYQVGDPYMRAQKRPDWWNLHGGEIERIYGQPRAVPASPEGLQIEPDALRRLAGFFASTEPNSDLVPNARWATEYERRVRAGEPVIQPDFRVPPNAVGHLTNIGQRMGGPGTQAPMEANRMANLRASAEGRLTDLSRDKVRNASQAMAGDQDAFVGDRYWAKISEKPEAGVYAHVMPNRLPPGKPYQAMHGVVRRSAAQQGEPPAIYSAKVWAGIRDTILKKGELFGQKYRTTARGESAGYEDLLPRLIEEKARLWGMSAADFERGLERGDWSLLSAVLASPVVWEAFQAWSKKRQESPPRGGI